MNASRPGGAALALLFAALLATGTGAAAPKKKARKPAPTPTPTAAPTPTPGPPLHKAAGSCLRYEPGAYVMMSEVGHPGRAFKIDAETVIAVRIQSGVRLRILYVDAPEGPVARKIMPGPAEEK